MSRAQREPHLTLRRVVLVFAAMPLIVLATGGTAMPAPKWAVEIVSAQLDGNEIVITGTAHSPAGESSGNYLEIVWGDGTAPLILPNFTGNGPWPWGPQSHQYVTPGGYTITATLLHASLRGNDRSQATDSVHVTIPDPPGVDPPGEDPPGEDPPAQVAAQGSVNVALGSCDSDDTGSLTPVDVLIAPEGSASVILTDGTDLIHVFDGAGGSVDLEPGSYTWTATASDGFTLVDPVAGQLTVKDCPSVVLAGPPETRTANSGAIVLPAQLAKTGPGLPVLLAIGMWLVAAGWFLRRSDRRKAMEAV